MAPSTVVPSRQDRRSLYGLVAAVGGEARIREFMAANPPEGGADRWLDGFQFWPLDCASNEGSFDPTCGGAFDPTLAATPDVATYKPFGLLDAIKCSTVSRPGDELDARSRAKLLTSTSHKLEAEFWSGTLSQSRGDANRYLAQNGEVTEIDSGNPVPLAYALARLQRSAGECAQGSRLMIHAPIDVASLWVAAGLVRAEGGVLLDALGNIVVAGSGYNGSAPDGTARTTDNAWAYATGVVDVRLSEIELSRWTDPTNNVQWAIAQRVGAVTWDLCCHVGVNVDVCTVCCTPES